MQFENSSCEKDKYPLLLYINIIIKFIIINYIINYNIIITILLLIINDCCTKVICDILNTNFFIIIVKYIIINYYENLNYYYMNKNN